MQELIGLIDMVADRMSTVASSDVIAGDPIQAGAVTIVPLSRISMGFGGAGGQGEGEPPREKQKAHKHHKGKGTGGGAGGGAKVRPVGIAVFSDKGVEILPIPTKKGALDKIFDKVPELLEKIREVVEKKG